MLIAHKYLLKKSGVTLRREPGERNDDLGQCMHLFGTSPRCQS